METLMMTGLSMMLNLASGPWLVIDDEVMGGVSSSKMVRLKDRMRFAGDLSLDNNGGFSSTRRLLASSPSGATHVRLVVKGDGRRYQLRLRMDERFDGVSWRAEFDTDGDWQALDIPLDDFDPVFRGRPVRGAGPVVADEVSQVGFLIADRVEGAFQLDIRTLRFVAPDA